MYNEASTKALQAQTIEWLSSLNAADFNQSITANIEELRSVLRFHEYRYYVQNDPLTGKY